MTRLADLGDGTDDPSGEVVSLGATVEFQAFYREHYVETVRLARLLTGHPADADDLAQEAFVRVFRYRAPIETPAAFLRTTTVNICRSWLLARHRSDLRMTRHGSADDVLTDDDRELDASLRRLPDDQRAVVVLRYWLGMSEREIATALDCRPGTVKSRHARALRALRKELCNDR